MLVDLGRNDLGRVAEIGTVQVTELMDVRRYSHVMHIESSVVGRLAPGRRASDALRATFPAGTLSGRAQGAGDGDHRRARAHQARARTAAPSAGWAGTGAWTRASPSARSSAATAIAHVQAGAGIVADSVPATEYEETQNKAAALFRAIEVAAAQEDW